MRQELITHHFQTILAAATPAEVETRLQAARLVLTEVEYTALQGRLVSEPNRRAEMTEQNPLSWYAPWDGDFDLGDGEELARLAADLLSGRWTEAVEVALTLHGPEMNTSPPVIRVEVMTDWEGEGWQHDKLLPLPDGWTYEQVNKILWDGYTVYFEPINKPAEPETDEQEEGE